MQGESLRVGVEGRKGLSEATLKSGLKSLRASLGLPTVVVEDGGLRLAAAQPLPSEAGDHREAALRAARARFQALQSEASTFKDQIARARGPERGAVLRAMAEVARSLAVLQKELEVTHG